MCVFEYLYLRLTTLEILPKVTPRSHILLGSATSLISLAVSGNSQVKTRSKMDYIYNIDINMR